MAHSKQRSFSDRFRDLLEALKEALNPRQPAPVPVPVRDDWHSRRR